MSYKHVLVAIDLSPESRLLLNKGIFIAKPYEAKVSIIHVDNNYLDSYSGLINVNIDQNSIDKNTHNAIKNLVENSGYKIHQTLSCNGDLCQILLDAIKQYDIDIIVCGHHQDFWSKITSSARQIINTVNVDILIIPLKGKF
ncbi:Universal stress protein A [Candidatus Providencia siddallii]|uniref:Universal stress protein n=1 Tax=Candidatus Providencia siddallii TaxID=1715285 RepID=A0A0M6W6R3_9GAMM|nr:Universal stress protein A [Candidatus Providencia siddallii]